MNIASGSGQWQVPLAATPAAGKHCMSRRLRFARTALTCGLHGGVASARPALYPGARSTVWADPDAAWRQARRLILGLPLLGVHAVPSQPPS